MIASNKYGKYCIPESSKHRTVATTILGGRVYEEDTIQYILDHRGDGAVVHAGAYFGDFLPAISSPDNKVYAVEAVKENYECAKETLNLNFADNHQTELFHNALGATDGDIVKIITRDGNGKDVGCASQIEGKIHKAVGDNYEESTVITIDSMVPDDQHVSIIHLDVEGFEEEALKGALSTIKRCRPILIVECWQDEMLQTPFYVDEIYVLGYTVQHKIYENVIIAP